MSLTIQSDYITDGIAFFKSWLTIEHNIVFVTYIKEIFNMMGVTCEPIGDIANKYRHKSVFVPESIIPSVERGTKELIALPYISDAGKAIFGVLPDVDKQIVTIIKQRPAGHTKKLINGIEYYFSPKD